MNRTYELIRTLLIGILFKKERTWKRGRKEREKERKTDGQIEAGKKKEAEMRVARGEEERVREKEREGERPVVHDRDTLISRGCPEGRREASSNS